VAQQRELLSLFDFRRWFAHKTAGQEQVEYQTSPWT